MTKGSLCEARGASKVAVVPPCGTFKREGRREGASEREHECEKARERARAEEREREDE